MENEGAQPQLASNTQIYDSLKDLDGLKLSTKKASYIQELNKLIQQINSVDTSKNKEREKIYKIFEKVDVVLLSIKVVEKLLKEKDF
jgi:hypothetical protein